MVITRRDNSLASLLPYLKADAGVRLTLFNDQPAQRECTYPFVVVDDADATSRLVEGGFVTDGGSLLKQCYLLVQKDLYSVHELRNVTNSDMDANWQRIFSALDGRSTAGHHPILSCQVYGHGGLKQFAPLFYCRTKQQFFEPVCPVCGLSLQLCKDDQLLSQNGLRPYSSSTKRYLYCAACCALGCQEFYLYDRDHTDPVSMNDRWSLIDKFRLVDEEKDPTGEFPCVRCTERDNCYGSNPLARTRIIPFSFYPFYLILFDAPTLHAADFLQLVSGAEPEWLEERLDPLRNPGRNKAIKNIAAEAALNTALFPAEDPGSFLEALFIKLSFLGDILERLGIDGLNAGIGIDDVWVHVSGPNALAGFGVEIIEKANPAGRARDSRLSPLGVLWFQALLQDRNLGRDEIRRAAFRYVSGSKSSLEALAVPANHRWDGQEISLPAEWLSLWEEACGIGFMILHGSCVEGVASVHDSLKILLALIKATMIGPEIQHLPDIDQQRTDVSEQVEALVVQQASADVPTASVEQQDQLQVQPIDEELLQNVIARLIARYRNAMAATPAVQSADKAVEVGADEDELATVILTRPAPVRPAIPAEDDMITETVILSAKPLAPSAPVDADSGIMETMLITRGRNSHGAMSAPLNVPAAAVPDDNDLLGETVVIMPKGRPRPRGFDQ